MRGGGPGSADCDIVWVLLCPCTETNAFVIQLTRCGHAGGGSHPFAIAVWDPKVWPESKVSAESTQTEAFASCQRGWARPL